MIRTKCPHCHTKITVANEAHTITCSGCNRQFAVRAKVKPPRPDAAVSTAVATTNDARKAAAEKPASRKSAAPVKVTPVKVAPAKVAAAKVAPAAAAPPKVKPAQVAPAIVAPAPAVPSVHAGPSTVRRTHGLPRRRKNTSTLLVSLLLLIGAVAAGGVFAYVVFGPQREESSQLAANGQPVNEGPRDETSADAAPAADSADATEPADAAAEPRDVTSADASGTDADGAKASEGPDDGTPQESTDPNDKENEAEPDADATSGTNSEPAADPDAEEGSTPTDPSIANQPESEPGEEPDPESAPKPAAEPEVPGVEITFEDANKVLQDIMSHWNARTPFATAVTAADHIASFDIPEWETREYHLDKYEIEHEDGFKSKTEQRFRVSMYFLDQDTEPILLRLYSLTVNAEGRWVIARIRKPKPDLKDAPRADLF